MLSAISYLRHSHIILKMHNTFNHEIPFYDPWE
jgi:hypothetical protein